MLNPDFEINQLRWKLSNSDLTSEEVEYICNHALIDIDEAILSIVGDAVLESIEYARSIGADEFENDIDLTESSGTFTIRTRSGQTDYSTHEREMLSDLIKNGKTSKDGTRYQVIPIREKVQPKLVGSSMFDMAKNIQAQQEIIRNQLKENNVRPSSAHLAQQLMESVRNNSLPKRAKAEGAITSFKTATSKQDASTQWVYPEQDKDMTMYLNELNVRVERSIDDTVGSIIRTYIETYA